MLLLYDVLYKPPYEACKEYSSFPSHFVSFLCFCLLLSLTHNPLGRGMERLMAPPLINNIDVDWARDATDHRSTSGFMFSLGSVAIAWSSKKQLIIAMLSTEAYYRRATVAMCEAIWLK